MGEITRFRPVPPVRPLASGRADSGKRSTAPIGSEAAGAEFKEECVVNDKPGCGLHIEWGRVKAAYKGILITPFHQNLPRTAPDFHWYKGWDCASGCFWNLTCLRQVTQGVRTNLCDRGGRDPGRLT